MEENEKLLFDLLRLHDQERQELSNDLYHDIGQTMYSLTLAIKMVVKQNIDDTTRKHLLLLEKAIDVSLEKLREISFELHPFMIEDLGLVETLGSFFRRMEQAANCSIPLTVKGKPVQLPLEKEHLIYRICQEILKYLAAEHKIDTISTELTYGMKESTELTFGVKSSTAISAQQVEEDVKLTTKRIAMMNGEVDFVDGAGANKVEIRIRIP